MSATRSSTMIVSAVFMLVIGLCTSLLPALQAQEEDTDLFLQSLPEDAVFYMDMNHIQDHVDRIESQVLQQMNDEQKDTYEKRKQELLNEISSSAREEMGFNPVDLMSHITRIRMGVASSKFDLQNMEPDRTLEESSFLIAYGLDRADAASQLLSGQVADQLSPEKDVNGYTLYRIKTSEKTEESPTSYLLHKGKQLYVTDDVQRLTGIAEGPGSEHLPDTSLADSDSFQSSDSTSTSASDLVDVRMNITSLWGQVEGSLKKQQKAIYKQAATILGFEEMESLSMGMDLGESTLSYQMAVHMTGNDFPLYDLLIQGDPGPLNMLNTIPDDAITGSASRIPNYADRLPAIKKQVVEGITMFGQSEKKAKQQWGMMQAMAKKQLGVGVKPLLEQFGTEMAYYMRAPESTEEDSGSKQPTQNFVFRISLKDGDKFRDMFENKIRSSSGYKQFKKMESTSTHDGVKVYSYETPEGINPSMFVNNDQLVVAGSAEQAKAVLQQGAQPDNSIAGASWFQDLRSQLPDSLTHLQFTALSKYADYMQTLQKQVQKQAGQNELSDMMDGDGMLDMLKNVYGAESGIVVGAVTESDRVSVDGTGEFDPSSIDPDTVNEALKSMTNELKKEDENDQNDQENGNQKNDDSETESF